MLKILKVKIFTGATKNEFGDLQDKVNKWLNDNCNKISIVSYHVTESCGTNSIGEPFVNLTITIFYLSTE